MLDLFGIPVPEYMDGKVLAVGGRLGERSPASRAELLRSRADSLKLISPARQAGPRTPNDALPQEIGARRRCRRACGGGAYWLGSVNRVSQALGKKVIVIGIDGMDPRLSRA